jgi:hypothetical protein
MYKLSLLRYEQQVGQARAKNLELRASTEILGIDRDPTSGDLILSLANGGTSRRGRI